MAPSGAVYEGLIPTGATAGKFVGSNGNEYVGSFSGNQITGFGTMTFANGKYKTGQWRNTSLVVDIGAGNATMNTPDLGPGVAVINNKANWCGPISWVSLWAHHLPTLYSLTYLVI